MARRLTQLEQEIGAAGQSQIDLDQLTTTLVEFDGIRGALLPNEKGQLIRCLVQQVVCEPEGKVQVVVRMPLQQ